MNIKKRIAELTIEEMKLNYENEQITFNFRREQTELDKRREKAQSDFEEKYHKILQEIRLLEIKSEELDIF